jgi:hypothetical protein
MARIRIRATMATKLFVMILISAFSWASIVEANADFDWDIVRMAGYPLFSFANASENEVVFKYSVSGVSSTTYGDTKYIRANVYTSDCITTSNLPAILVQQELTEADEYTVGVNIMEAFISNSDYYQQTNPTNATIGFCIRLDYLYDPKDGSEPSSINFHETNVTVAVDLTAGFSLTEGLSVDRNEAGQESAAVALEYPVTAYFCNSDSVKVPAPVLSQGSALQFCVEREGSVANDVYLSDILTVNLDQSGVGGDGVGVHADPITGAVADPFTSKTCTAGICNIQTQLMSKWFAEADPESMDITGTALLAFGSATDGRRRYLRVSFASAQGQEKEQQQQQRNLQDLQTLTDPIEDLMGEFGLKVDLEGDPAEEDNRTGMIIVCVAVSVGSTLFCCILSCCCCRKKVTKKTTTTIHEHSMPGGPAFQPPPPPSPPLMHMHMYLPQIAPVPQDMQPPANATTNIVIQGPAADREPVPPPPPPPQTPPPPPSYHHQSAQIYPAPTFARQSLPLYPTSTYNHHDDDDDDVIIMQDRPASTYNHHDDDSDVIIEQDHVTSSTPSTGSTEWNTSSASCTSFNNDHGDDDEIIILAVSDGRQPTPTVVSKRQPKLNKSRKSSQHGDTRKSQTETTARSFRPSDGSKSHHYDASKKRTETTAMQCQYVD